MEIRTKFNIGDVVYIVAIPLGATFYCAYDKDTIIAINTYNGICNVIEYCFKNYSPKKEQDCFATKEEAQAECDKRNKGE